ncbi:MAG: GNAT family N-acetyltransferase [Deltaproteobacteria bacterium]|nr:GNAT family N-acetyltransferase [Deltaproteobacteria bacterium]
MGIREATHGDRDALLGIIDATENLTEEEKDCAAELLQIYIDEVDQDDYLFLVACNEDSGEVEGFLCYGLASLSSGVYDIYWIVVSPVKMMKGVGRSLVSEVERKASAVGIREIIIETSSLDSYKGSREFYGKLGFIEEARVKDFFKVGDDKVFFIKNI